MFFELRQYRTLPGKRAEWVASMEAVILPFQVATGMVVVGSFVGQEEDDDLCVWIRRFASEEERVARYRAVYESDFWKQDVAPKVGALLDHARSIITRIEAMPTSVLQ